MKEDANYNERKEKDSPYDRTITHNMKVKDGIVVVRRLICRRNLQIKLVKQLKFYIPKNYISSNPKDIATFLLKQLRNQKEFKIETSADNASTNTQMQYKLEKMQLK